MKIIADTATLIPPSEGNAYGLTVIPVCVAIDGQTYQDYTQISSEEFLKKVKMGGIPTSSQPSIGDMLEQMDGPDEEILALTVGDGLSGGYQTALGARNLVAFPERIHVMDSRTLAGPLRYLANKAVMLKEQGLNIDAIKEKLQNCIDSSMSFVIPEDFEFLKRSGRLTPFAAKVGSKLKLLPVLTQTKDMKRIVPIGIKRSWNAAVDTILQQMKAKNVGSNHLITISHAGVPQRAEQVLKQVREYFVSSDIEILELSPALTTHGGPGCIVIQAICK